MSETAIGEFIDDGAAQPTRKIIIYERTEVSTNGCENDNQKDVHTVVSHRFPRSRWHYDFRGERDK